MSKLVILKIGAGELEQGFPVTLQISEDGYFPLTEIRGRLPPAPEIYQHYSSWQLAYNTLRLGIRRLERRFAEVTNFSMVDIKEKAQILSLSLNMWLNSELFRPIKEQLLVNLAPSDEFRFIIQTGDTRLRQLPWHLWNFFELYNKAEVAFSANQYRRVERATKAISRNKVRILAILGNSTGINIEQERELLEKLPNCEITFLAEPQRSELNRYLWDEKGWDILFFAGHSSSHNNFEQGQICINQMDSVTIEELKYGLRKAIKQGLKLAIFNSCDGLGLARELEELNIPQVIVMRESVPDLVAQEFLKGFLVAFSSGKSLYVSVREARERLQGLEDQFPCASWLPVISQNPAEVPVTWQELQRSTKAISPEISTLAKNELLLAGAVSFLNEFLLAGTVSLLLAGSCYLLKIDIRLYAILSPVASHVITEGVKQSQKVKLTRLYKPGDWHQLK
ncbi:CHAT domain-containing protein [Microcoleus sp. herbarium14]|uniref:CHAT domain-containing protein n=1 Tax=Microcoleus sp. herbarium14 TaxID=3055439 RepID=UPI002FD314BC